MELTSAGAGRSVVASGARAASLRRWYRRLLSLVSAELMAGAASLA
jgi:hypothetical protein